MFIKSRNLLIPCLWFLNFIGVNAQERHLFYNNNEAIRVFPSPTYNEIRCNQLKNQVSFRLTVDEINELNELLSMRITPRGNRLSTLLKAQGLLIVVGNVSGVYLSDKGYRKVFGGENQWGSGGAFPAKIRARVDSFINKFQHRIPPIQKYYCYSRFPISCHVEHYPERLPYVYWDTRIMVKFFVSVDSLRTIPLEYIIKGKKRKGAKEIIRAIPFWDYYAPKDLGYHWKGMDYPSGPSQENEDSTLYKILVKWFPSWPQMTDQERMRMLDNIIINQLKKPDNNK